MANPLFPTDTIKDIAESLGIQTISPDAAKQLAMDVEYRIQEVVQEGLKFMRHSKRTVLSPADISNALKALNIEVSPSNLTVAELGSLCMDTIHPDRSSFEKRQQPKDYNYITWTTRKSSLRRS
jgi:histone H3/H4